MLHLKLLELNFILAKSRFFIVESVAIAGPIYGLAAVHGDAVADLPITKYSNLYWYLFADMLLVSSDQVQFNEI